MTRAKVTGFEKQNW